MKEHDFQLILRAKRQVDRESAWRFFLVFGTVFCAALRMLGVEAPLHFALFACLFVFLILSSDLIGNFGIVSKRELISVIENHIHSDPDTLQRFSSSRHNSR